MRRAVCNRPLSSLPRAATRASTVPRPHSRSPLVPVHTHSMAIEPHLTSERLSAADVRGKRGFILDMDGVIYWGSQLLPGAREFVEWLTAEGREFLFLTNSSERSPRELREKLGRLGVEVSERHFYTSALATASFLRSQLRVGGSAYVIGEPGLISALYDEGFSMNDTNPDFVVVGETRNYSYERIEHAVRLVNGGARLIGTNLDVTDRVGGHLVPACGALIRPIELATGRRPYFVGKPNPVMMRTALQRLGVPAEDAIIVGDRMETDVLGGMESSIDTCLVLSGVTRPEDVLSFAYRPDAVFRGVGEIVPGGGGGGGGGSEGAVEGAMR